ncbi:hypothetical protein [Leeuwenhoekiella palythoae]|uniref:Uncharacterized protein n=1 Tax=Leeuwenhoekiella palythoae TaxID=573501 RepID=A0A1M5ZC21_9FLAO|nr:hypothetical protein [Leeuwenhoekiella palythoae]SHI21748.1 hypothetical protein SAMN04487999_2907 [Leeuwenhoekiella palythoae]
MYGKRIRSNQGAGGYYLCKSCNNLTGSYYGESYKKFAYMGMMAVTNRIWASKVIAFEYAIQPLNILKQVLSMFMSIDTSDQLLNLERLSKFLLDKDSQALPENIRVFVYHTATKQVRNGWGMARTEKGFHTLGEITYPPFGLVYALDSEPTRNDFFEISGFKNYVFNQTVQARLTIPFLTPKTYIPGLYT